MNSLYVLTEKKFIPALNKVDGRIVYDSNGDLFITDKFTYRKITRYSILANNETVDNLTETQYDLFFKIARNYVSKQGYTKV